MRRGWVSLINTQMLLTYIIFNCAFEYDKSLSFVFYLLAYTLFVQLDNTLTKEDEINEEAEEYN